jgi:hypothetical protein
MKKQKKLTIKVRDLAPLKDVAGGRRRAHGLQAHASGHRGKSGAGLGPFGLRKVE